MSQQLLKTFYYYGGKRRPITYADALNYHPAIQEPTMEFLEAKTKIKRAIDSVHMRELWGGLMGTIDLDDEVTNFPSTVEFTVPLDLKPFVQQQTGIVASFAFCELAKQLKDVSALDDYYEVREAMLRGWEEVERRAQEANEIEEGFGCDQSQSWLTLRDIGKDPNSENLQDKMLAIARLAGRMFKSFGYHHRIHPNSDPEEVVGASIGPQLDRILDSELALLADEDTEDMAAMKILEGRATITKMAGKEERTRGPLVLCIDESGSMHDGDLGMGWSSSSIKWAGRNTWAKACAVALTRIAWSENRPVRAVHFGNGNVVQEVPKDDNQALFEMARSFMSGGTDFGSALCRARSVVGDLDTDGYKGADILLITDGEDHDHDAHNEEIDCMDRDDIKLWTVAIGQDIGEDNPVRKRCEKYTYAADRQLPNADTATQLAEGLDQAAMGNESDTLN